MLWFVVPTFAGMFKDLGAELPSITQFVVGASNFAVRYGFQAAAALGVLAYASRRHYETERGRRRVRGFLIVLPTVGDLMVQSAMYRFSSNLALLLNSGVPMLETLETLRGIFGRDPIYRDALGQAQGRVAAGQSLTSALEEPGYSRA
jgi:type IV pilus assembly protein PilC